MACDKALDDYSFCADMKLSNSRSVTRNHNTWSLRNLD